MGQTVGGGQGVGAPPPSKNIWVGPSTSLAGTFMLKTEQAPKSVSVAIAIRSFIRLTSGDMFAQEMARGGVFGLLGILTFFVLMQSRIR